MKILFINIGETEKNQDLLVDHVHHVIKENHLSVNLKKYLLIQLIQIRLDLLIKTIM